MRYRQRTTSERGYTHPLVFTVYKRYFKILEDYIPLDELFDEVYQIAALLKTWQDVHGVSNREVLKMAYKELYALAKSYGVAKLTSGIGKQRKQKWTKLNPFVQNVAVL